MDQLHTVINVTIDHIECLKFSFLLQDVVLSDVASFQTLHECISWFLGIQGPVIVTQAGERVVIHFKNLAAQPYSISPVGISYWKQSEGELSQMLNFCRHHVLVHFLT